MADDAYPMALVGDQAGHIEAMAEGIAGMGASPNCVPIRGLPEAGNKVDLGIIGLAAASGWYDMSVFFRTYHSEMTVELKVDFSTSDNLPPEFRFFVAESDTGQVTGELVGVDGTEWLFSERVNKDLTHASIPAAIKTRFRHRVSVQPRASLRIAAQAIPTTGTILSASVQLWAAGVEILT